MALSRTSRRGGRGFITSTASRPGSRSAPFLLSPSALSGARSQARWTDPDAYAVPFPARASAFLPTDRRLYNPSPAFVEPARRFSGRPARVVAPPPSRALQRAKKGLPAPLHNAGGLFFQSPGHVAVCVQRGVRREVMFAKGYAGRAGINRKPGRQGPFSQVRCT